MIKKYFSISALYFLIAILIIELAFNLVLKYRALNDDVIINSTAGKVSMDEISIILRMI